MGRTGFEGREVMETTTIHPNGFIQVGEYYVQGIQANLRYSSDRANASRPSCTCGALSNVWCAHKAAADKAYRASVE